MNNADTVLETFGSVVTWMLQQFTSMTTTLYNNKLFLIAFAVFVIGCSIGLVKRVIS